MPKHESDRTLRPPSLVTLCFLRKWGRLIFPTSQISDTISVGKMRHFLSCFSDISFFLQFFHCYKLQELLIFYKICIHIFNPELLENRMYVFF